MAFDEEIKIGVDLDTGKATKSLEELAKDIQAITEKDGNKSSQRLGLEKQLDEALKKAQMLSKQLKDPLHFAVEDKSLTKALYNVERLEGELKKYQQFIKNKDLVMANALTDSEYNSAKSEKSNYAFEINHNIIPALDAAKRKLDEFKDASGDFKVNIDTDALHKTEDAYDSLISKINMLIKKEDELTAKENKVVGGSGVQQTNRHLLSIYQTMRIINNAVTSTARLFRNAFQFMVDAVKSLYNALKNLVSFIASTLIGAFQKLASIIRSVASVLKNVFVKALRTSLSLLKQIGKVGVSAFKGIASGIKNALGAMKLQRKETEKTEFSFKRLLDAVLKYGFGIRSLYFAVRKLKEFLKDGFSYLIDADENFKSLIDQLKGGIDTIKLALTGAFTPLVEYVMPYLMQFIHILVDAIGYLGQFFAALTGQTTYRKAIWQVQSLEDTLKDLQEAQEEENKATKQQLAGFDELNNLTTSAAQKKKETEDVKIPYDMLWEDVPIDSKVLDILDKLKKLLNDLLGPIKNAWNKWKDAIIADLKDLWKWIKQLAKDFWRDFIKVWNGPDMAKVFDNLFGMFDDIIKTLRNLIRQFDIAWNTNNVGLHILEDIAHILRIITDHARNITKAFVEWSDTLDFYPLLAAIERWLKSCFRLVDAICQMIEDFVKVVFLPFLKYLIEVGVPKIFDAFTEFNDKVNWERLTELVRRFWTALEPLLEMSFEALIKGLRLLLDVIADFLNGNFIERFVEDFEHLVASLQSASGPMDVIDALFDFFNRRLSAWIDLLNSLIGKLNGFFDNFRAIKDGMSDLQRLAQDIANIINTLLSQTDWGGLGALISNVLKTIMELSTEILNRLDKQALYDAVYNFLTGLDWPGLFEDFKAFLLASVNIIKTIATAIIDVFRNAFGLITPASLAEKLSDFTITLLNFFTNLFNGINKEKLAENIKEFLINIKWKEIFTALGNFLKASAEIIGAVKDGIIGALKEAFKNVTPESLAEGVNNLADKLHQKISDALDKLSSGEKGSEWANLIARFIKAVRWDEIWQNLKTDIKRIWEAFSAEFEAVVGESPEELLGKAASTLAGAFATIVVSKIAFAFAQAGLIGAIRGAFDAAVQGGALSGIGESLAGAFEALGVSLGTVAVVIATVIIVVDSLVSSFGGLSGLLEEIHKVFDPVIEDLKKFWENNAADTWEELKESFKHLQESLSNLAPFWDGLLKVLGVLVELVGKLVIPIIDLLMDYVSTLIDGISAGIDILSILLNAIFGFIGSVIDYFRYGKEEASKTWSEMVDKIIESAKHLKYVLIGDPIIIDLCEGIINAFIDMAKGVVDAVFGVFDYIIECFINLYNQVIETVTSMVTQVINMFVQLATELINAASKIATEVINFFSKLVTDVLALVEKLWSEAVKLFTKIHRDIVKIITTLWNDTVKLFNKIFEDVVAIINKMWNTFVELFTKIKNDVIRIITELWNDLVNLFNTIWQDIVTILNNLLTDAESIFNAIWDTIVRIVTRIWEDVVALFNRIREDIVNAIRQAVEDIGTIFNTLSEVFSTVMDKLRELWNSFWSTAADIVKTVINVVIEMFESAVNGIISGVNKMSEAVASIKAGIEGAASWTWNVVSNISLPRLATGTVVPPSMNEFVAVLGDNKHETEVVSPLSTMKEAMIEALNTMGYAGNNNGDIVVQIDGYEVFRAVREQNIMFTKSTGASAF